MWAGIILSNYTDVTHLKVDSTTSASRNILDIFIQIVEL